MSIIVFALVAFGILYGMNYAVFATYGALLGFSSAWLYALVGAASYFAAYMTSTFRNNWLTHGLYTLGSLWVGLVFLNLMGLAFIVPLWLWGLPAAPLVMGLNGVAVLLGVYYARSISVVRHSVGSPLRIVHLSDTHIHGPGAKKQFDRILHRALKEEPEVIVITGDFMDGPGAPDASAFTSLKDVQIPVLLVYGNHEFYVGEENVKRVLQDYGVHILRTHSFVHKGAQFVGVDDPTGGKQLVEELKKVKLNGSYRVLLYHQPTALDVASQHFDLMLSGHTHAGQLFPLNFLIGMAYKHIRGLHDIGDMKLYVSPGTSTWGPPLRLGSRSTIAVFD